MPRATVRKAQWEPVPPSPTMIPEADDAPIPYALGPVPPLPLSRVTTRTCCKLRGPSPDETELSRVKAPQQAFSSCWAGSSIQGRIAKKGPWGEGCCWELPDTGQEAESLKLPCQAQGLASKWPGGQAPGRVVSLLAPPTGRSQFPANRPGLQPKLTHICFRALFLPKQLNSLTSNTLP